MKRNIFFWMAVTLVVSAAVVTAVVWFGQGPGRFNTDVAKHIHKLCAGRSSCQVHLRDLFSYSEPWDRVYIFEPSASQELITSKVGDGVATADLLRTIVLMKGSYVIYQEHAPRGVESPLANQINLDCPDKGSDWVMCQADALLYVQESITNGDPATDRTRGHSYKLKSQ